MMGYLHDVSLAVVLPPNYGQRSGASWSIVRELSGQFELEKAAAEETFRLVVPVSLPASSGTKQGVKLGSVDFYFEVKTSNLEDISGAIELQDLPANGGAMAAPSTPAVTLSGADLDLVGKRRARISPDADLWLGPGQVCRAVLTFQVAEDTGFVYFGSRINFTLRE